MSRRTSVGGRRMCAEYNWYLYLLYFIVTGTNIATGFETSALITSYCVLMLAMHKDIQQQVYEEIVQHYGRDTRQPTVVYEDLNKLEFLDRVLKETLRLFPVVPYFARKLRKDFVLGTAWNFNLLLRSVEISN